MPGRSEHGRVAATGQSRRTEPRSRPNAAARRVASARARGLAGVVLVLAAGAAARDAQAIDGDILTARAGFGLVHDSNLFRLPEGVTVPGLDSRSDLIRSVSAALDFERDFSAQVVRIALGLRDNRYTEYSGLDGLDYSGSLGWRWLYGERSSVDVGLSQSRTTLGFADVRIPGRPVVDTTAMSVLGTLEVVPRWSAIAGTGVTTTENEPVSRSVLDYRLNYLEGGARYDWRTGSVFDFVWRRQAATFRQPSLATGADNGYDEDDVGVRMTWQATGATRIAGRAGVQSRSYRDGVRPSFTGPAFRLTADWQPRAALRISTTVRNELSAAAEISANFAQLRGVSTIANWQTTGKTSVRVGLDYLNRDFRSDAPAAAGVLQRRDRVGGASIGVAAQPWRFVELSAELRLDRRDSNFDNFDFDARTLTLRAGVVF